MGPFRGRPRTPKKNPLEASRGQSRTPKKSPGVPSRGQPRTPRKDPVVAENDALAAAAAAAGATSKENGGDTMGEILDVVTSVTRGMRIVGEGQMAQIFPNVSMGFIQVAAEAQATRQELADGPLTRGRLGTASQKFLELLPEQIGLAKPHPEVVSALELKPGPLQALLDRRREAEFEAVLRLEKPFMHQFAVPDVKPVILNVVASANVGMKLDLKRIGQACKNVEYNPKRFAPCVMRIREPKCTALVFSSGRMIVSGCKSENECKIALRKFARHIQTRLGLDPTTIVILHFEVQNISANAALKWPVRLRQMAEDPLVKQFVSYEAELFPGLVFTMIKPKCKIVIFVTGAVLMTGLRSEAELKIAMEMIFPICRRFRR